MSFGAPHRPLGEGSPLDLPSGLYVTNHMLAGYDTYEELGRCTNRCFFCCDGFKKFSGTGPQDFIKQSADDNQRIFLCGREPTGLDELFDKLGFLRRRYRTVSIATNGIRLADAQFTRRLAAAGVDELFFSLHGHEAAIHDRVTREPGSFEAAVAGIRQAAALRSQGTAQWRIAVNSVLSRGSLPHLEALLLRSQRLGAQAVCLSSLLPLGHGERAFAEEIISYRRLLSAAADACRHVEESQGGLPLAVFLLHVPFCAVPRDGAPSFTLWLSPTPGEFGAMVGAESRARCRGCRFDAFCEGVFDAYAARFGYEEFAMTELRAAPSTAGTGEVTEPVAEGAVPAPGEAPAAARARIVETVLSESGAVFCTSVDGELDQIPSDLSHLSYFRLDPALAYRFLYYYDTGELLQYSRLITESSMLIRCGDIECINAIIPLFYFFYGFMPPLDSYGRLHPLSSELQAKMHFGHLSGDDPSLVDPLLAVSTALEVTDGHVVFGPEDMIEGALDRLLEQRFSPCIFSHSCINKVIGTDMEGIIARAAEQHATKIVHDCNVGIEQFHRDVARVYDECIRDTAAARAPKPGSLNLVGFDRTPALEEMAATLQGLELSINEICVPDVDRRAMPNLGRAALQVLNPVAGYEQIYQSLFRRLEVPTIMPPAPYGFDATARWFAQVATALQVDLEHHDGYRAAVASHQLELDTLREQASSYRVGLVVAPADLEALQRPAHFFYAIDIVGLLEEMGFGIEFCVTRAPDRARAQAKIARLLKEPSRHHTTFVATLQDTRRWLRDTPCRCIYSDIKHDHRLLRSGKAGFSLFLFEMGFAGFHRSIRRLLDLCGTSFYDDYQDYRKQLARPLGA